MILSIRVQFDTVMKTSNDICFMTKIIIIIEDYAGRIINL